MLEQKFVVLTHEHDGEREFVGRLPYTTELCAMISSQLDGSPKFEAIAPIEVAVKLGSGSRIYVRTDRIYSYRIDEDS